MKIPTIFAASCLLCAAKEEDGALLQRRHIEEHRNKQSSKFYYFYYSEDPADEAHIIYEDPCEDPEKVPFPHDCATCNTRAPHHSGHLYTCVYSAAVKEAKNGEGGCIKEGRMNHEALESDANPTGLITDDLNFCPRPNEECDLEGCSKCHEYNETTGEAICTNCNIGYYWVGGHCKPRIAVPPKASTCYGLNEILERDNRNPAPNGFNWWPSCETCRMFYENTGGVLGNLECTFNPVNGKCLSVQDAATEGVYTDEYCEEGLYDGFQNAGHPECAVQVLLSYKETLCRWPDPSGYLYWVNRCEEDVGNGTWTGSWEDIKKIMARKHRNGKEYKDLKKADNPTVVDDRETACAPEEQTWGCVNEVTTCMHASANVYLTGEGLWESGFKLTK